MHTVQEGQSFWVIAAYYDLDVETLLALNGLNENVFLHAGDELVIRPAEEPPAVAEAAAGATATPLAAPSPLALATPLPRLTPLATSVPTDADPPSEQGTKGGGFRRVATGAVIGLAVVGAGLVAWGLRRRPGDA